MTNGLKEAFLHFLWQNRLFHFIDVNTTTGEPLKIIHPGFHNSDAGPDFRQAIVRIGMMTWAGDVEIHIRSSDWYRHQHQTDEKYESVILHVVYEHDRDVYRQSREVFPTLELKSRIPDTMYRRYLSMMEATDFLSCRFYLPEIDGLLMTGTVASMAIERLQNKQKSVLELVKACHDDWNEGMYRQLAVSFGFKTNADAFELLAKSLPYKVVAKHLASPLQVHALVFGQAGMLEGPAADEYQEQLQYEYDFLRYKYRLSPIAESHWNLLRLRPRNFPCMRLAQFAELLHSVPDLFPSFVENPSMACFRRILDVRPPDYWRTHFQFGKETEAHSVGIGIMTWSLLMINAVIPALFAFNRFSGNEVLQEQAVELLEQLPFESNKYTRCFENTPFPRKSALESQALIELYLNYCARKRCLDCPVGNHIVRNIRS